VSATCRHTAPPHLVTSKAVSSEMRRPESAHGSRVVTAVTASPLSHAPRRVAPLNQPPFGAYPAPQPPHPRATPPASPASPHRGPGSGGGGVVDESLSDSASKLVPSECASHSIPKTASQAPRHLPNPHSKQLTV
jgi:hypothetical protein